MQKEKERLEELGGRLGLLQRQCKEAGIPVLILFDGYDAAGKGYQINRLLQALDPRGFDVYTGDKDGEEEGDLRRRPPKRAGSLFLIPAGTAG